MGVTISLAVPFVMDADAPPEIPQDIMDEHFSPVEVPLDQIDIPMDTMSDDGELEVHMVDDDDPLLPADSPMELQLQQGRVLKTLKDYRRGPKPKRQQKRDGASWSILASGGMGSGLCPDHLLCIPPALDGTLQDDLLEVFSEPRVIPLAAAHGLRARVSLDLMNGWDGLTRCGKRRLFMSWHRDVLGWQFSLHPALFSQP